MSYCYFGRVWLHRLPDLPPTLPASLHTQLLLTVRLPYALKVANGMRHCSKTLEAAGGDKRICVVGA
eukprot:5942811-Alexandrium_andersonii.AAC.1